MEYFYITAQIVFGVLIPAFIFLGFKAICEAIGGWCGYWQQHDIRYKLIEKGWDFVSHHACPNPSYVSLRFKNRETQDEIEIGCERVKLP
jgi:hypothetical protein